MSLASEYFYQMPYTVYSNSIPFLLKMLIHSNLWPKSCIYFKYLMCLVIYCIVDFYCFREELSRCSPKELEKRGLGLRRLLIKRTTHGLYGKFLVKLVRAELSATASKSNDKNSRPSRNVFSNGDIAQLTLLPADSDSVSNSAASLNRNRSNPSASSSGIVYKVTARGITVAFDEAPEFLLDAGGAEAEYSLVRMPSEVTYRRMKDALRNVLAPPASLPHLARLVGVLFVEEQLAIVPPPEQPTAENEVSFFNRDLNDSQREAVEFALRQSHIAIIHGPPGTGKTTTVVELIRQLVQRNQKVLLFSLLLESLPPTCFLLSISLSALLIYPCPRVLA